VKLFSKNSNLYEHDTSTLQTDTRTDGKLAMAIRIVASRGKNDYRTLGHLFADNNLQDIFSQAMFTAASVVRQAVIYTHGQLRAQQSTVNG